MKVKILMMLGLVLLILVGCHSEAKVVNDGPTDVSIIAIDEVDAEIKAWIDERKDNNGSYIYQGNDESYVLIVSDEIDNENYTMTIDDSNLSNRCIGFIISEISTDESLNSIESPLIVLIRANGAIEEATITKDRKMLATTNNHRKEHLF